MSDNSYLRRLVLVKCQCEYCEELIWSQLNHAGHRYCETCRAEARLIRERNYYWQNVKRSREQKRRNYAAYYTEHGAEVQARKRARRAAS